MAQTTQNEGATAVAATEQLPAVQQTAGTQQPPGQGTTPPARQSFGTFTWSITIAIILAIFCYMYFYVRRQRAPRHVDEKAGDEGED